MKENSMDKILAGVATFITLIGSVSAGYLYLDTRYALATELNALERKVDKMELEDLYKDALENLYFYRSQNRKYPDDKEIQDRLKEAQDEVDHIKKQLDEIEKQENEAKIEKKDK